MTFHGYEQDPVSMLWRVIRHLASKIAKGSLCIGKFIEDVYGIECDRLSIGAVQKMEKQLPESSGLIYVGRVEPDTGIMSYVEALQILRRKYNLTVPLTVCGEGSLSEDIRRIAQHSGLDITLKGLVDNPAEYIDGSLASLSAGYLSILESMMMGVPVIGMARTYLRHRYLLAVRDAGGPISIQTSASGIADEILRLYRDDSLQENLSHRSRRFAEKQSWERLADLYVKMWTT
jgi:glycosyltransferase involved in cell wall biosynthesis